jgi:hypothetical protein
LPVLKRDPIVVRDFSIMPNGEFFHGRVLPPPLRKRDASVVSLCFFRPTRRANVYKCAYEIRKDRKVVLRFRASGIDAVGALLNAMESVVIDLETRYLNEWRVSVPKAYFDDMRGS